MWLLKNTTPFAADNSWVRDIDGSEVLLAVIKATVRIQEDGRIALEAEQREVCDIPKFRGAPECASLPFESDFVRKKSRTDVLVEGRAFAPGAKAVSRVDVRVKAVNIDKTLRVHGDRVIGNSAFGVEPSHPEPVLEMPILYEKTCCGTDLKDEDPSRHDWKPRSPVGVGLANDDRRENTYSFLPANFDIAYYQAAPRDLRIATPGGGEDVPLLNLPHDGLMSFRPAKEDVATIFFRKREPDTDAIARRNRPFLEADENRLSLSWRLQLPDTRDVLEIRHVPVSKMSHVRLRARSLAKDCFPSLGDCTNVMRAGARAGNGE